MQTSSLTHLEQLLCTLLVPLIFVLKGVPSSVSTSTLSFLPLELSAQGMQEECFALESGRAVLQPWYHHEPPAGLGRVAWPLILSVLICKTKRTIAPSSRLFVRIN